MSTLSQFFGGTSGVPCEILLVGGGGPGGQVAGSQYNCGGGGGGGEVIFYTKVNIEKGVAYSIVIGAGGAGVSAATGSLGSNGGDTSFGPVIAGGGGRGGAYDSSYGLINPLTGNSGSVGSTGSGGGAHGSSAWNTNLAGALTGGSFATLDPFIFGAAAIDANNSGGASFGNQNNGSHRGGGGGGAGGTTGYPGTVIPTVASDSIYLGGAGKGYSITGSPVVYAAGGNGGRGFLNAAGASASSNTGDGGGGASGQNGGSYNSGSGGSGIVVIAYLSTYPAPSAISGTYSTPSRTGYRVYQFTGSGSITL